MAVPCAPGVDRVLGFEAWLQHRSQTVFARLGKRRQVDTDLLCRVDQQRALTARVEDCPEGAGSGRPAAGEDFERVGHLLHRGDAMDSMSGEESVVGQVFSRQRTGMCGGGRPPTFGPAYLEGDDRHVELGRPIQSGRHELRAAHRFEEHPHHPRGIELDGVGQILRHRGGDLLAGGDDEVEIQAAAVVEHRCEQ